MWKCALLLVLVPAAVVAQNPGSSGSQPATPEAKGKVIGIGGIFFKTADPAQTREWYRKHLGLTGKGGIAILPWRDRNDPQIERMTVWRAFPTSTKYFDPGTSSFMVNYIVDDLDALLERLQKEGVKIDPKRQDDAFGKFAWIYDADGNKVELWQPATARR